MMHVHVHVDLHYELILYQQNYYHFRASSRPVTVNPLNCKHYLICEINNVFEHRYDNKSIRLGYTLNMSIILIIILANLSSVIC